MILRTKAIIFVEIDGQALYGAPKGAKCFKVAGSVSFSMLRPNNP